jgi:signal transduction histidine kinase/DNA-binding response OmpR family regulator
VRLHKNGRAIPVSVTVSPVMGSDGRLIGVSKILRDVTGQKRSEEMRLNAIHLEAENRQIQKANRLKTEFLANMSHELRTPLNAIIGFSDLLQMGSVGPGSPKQAEFLGYIGTSGRHLLTLINDLLDLSKVEAGKFEIYPETLDLDATVQEVCNIVRGEADKKALTLRVEPHPTLAEVVLDPARLKQVLYNYLSNAIKFTPHGGHVTVRIGPEDAQHFRIEVEDDGIGISEANVARLFVSFQQLDAGYTKRHQGTGLGLALTRRLVELQGGRVGVHSRLGEGSTFFAVLPRRGSRITQEDAHTRPGSGAGLAGGEHAASDAARILVVDHDPTNQARMTHLLGEAGYDVDGVSTPDQAMRVAMLQPYDAITLSLGPQDGDGLQVLANIRSGQLNSEVPVVMLTMASELQQVAGFVVSDVLPKPMELPVLESALARSGITRGSRVLVVDDDPLALQLMREALEAMGVQAGCEQNSRQALQRLDADQPQAMILDLMMPGYDGFSVLDAVRAHAQWKHLPVFIWTSMKLSEQDVESLSRSVGAILGKGRGTLNSLTELLDELAQQPPPKRRTH